MRENCTYVLTRGSRRKTAKSVLRVVEDRAGVPGEGRSALLYPLLIQSQGFWYNARMRKNRFIGQDRCYHLVSRLAHRAFFLDDEEKDRARR